MAIYDMPNITDGFDNALTGLAQEVPAFTPMLLIFTFCVVFIGGIVSQKSRSGYADIPMWSTVASLSTLLIALPMTMTSGMINIEILSIVVVITILSGVWLFTGRNKNEI